MYGSATPGHVCVQSIHTVADQATRKSKGQPGVLVIGTVKSKYQHYKIEYRDMWREAFIVGRKGVVRTPEKWGWRSGHFSITLLVSGSSANSTDVSSVFTQMYQLCCIMQQYQPETSSTLDCSARLLLSQEEKVLHSTMLGFMLGSLQSLRHCSLRHVSD